MRHYIWGYCNASHLERTMTTSTAGRPRKGAEKNRPRLIGQHVTEAVFDGLAELARERGVSRSDIAHEALEEYLARHAKRRARETRQAA